MSAVNQRRISSQQLKRRDLNMITLADRLARGTIGLGLLARANLCFVSSFARQHRSSGFLLITHACRLTKTESSNGLDQLVPAQTLAERREVIVARIRNRLRRSERWQ